MFTIGNSDIKATFNPKGAELTSLVLLSANLEFMWEGNPAVWGKHSPVLFPIVGSLKSNTYQVGGQSYQLSRHGFARDHQFAVETQTADAITFLLKSSEDTLKVFPFHFEFRLRYTVTGTSLAATYLVTNTDKQPMYFSVGAHPAFKVPLEDGTAYEDYYLTFDQEETSPRWPIAADGTIEKTALPLLEQTRRLPLSKELFQKDALVFKGLKSSRLSLQSDKTSHGLDMDFPGFPFFGIWAAKDADFVCLEPWCGIADPVDHNQDLTTKEGINVLPAREVFIRTWTVTLY